MLGKCLLDKQLGLRRSDLVIAAAVLMEITWLFQDVLELGDVCFSDAISRIRKKWETSWYISEDKIKRGKRWYTWVQRRYSNCFFQDVRWDWRENAAHTPWGYRADGEDWGGHVGCGSRYALQGVGDPGVECAGSGIRLLECKRGLLYWFIMWFQWPHFLLPQFPLLQMRIIKIRA